MALDLRGINPATIAPMTDDGSTIDEPSLERHLTKLGHNDNVNALVTNGHAGELYGLSPDERDRVVEIAAGITTETPVISGVVGGSTTEFTTRIERVANAGADGILVVPPHTPIHTRPEAARQFFTDISTSSPVPLIIFQHPHWAGGHYPSHLLADLAGTDGVIGVKNAVWDVDHFQNDRRALRDSAADVQLLVGNDEHLLPSFILGTDGAVLELAAVIPDLIAELFEAVERSDVTSAQSTYDRMEPFINAMYEPPVTDSHTRLKVALALQGIIDHATPRPPAAPIQSDEVNAIKRAMTTTGVL